MNTKHITAANAENKIRQLYEMAFPEDEQIPWNDLMRLIGEMPLDFTAYYDGQAFIGFTIVYPRKSFNWFWYFAFIYPRRIYLPTQNSLKIVDSVSSGVISPPTISERW